MPYPTNIVQIPGELAVIWDNGHESYYKYDTLRKNCPCAGCSGETVMGVHYAPANKPNYTERSFQLIRLETIGNYGLKPVWADGHDTGIFHFQVLRAMCQCEVCRNTEEQNF
jgi:DUF971 family protein